MEHENVSMRNLAKAVAHESVKRDAVKHILQFFEYEHLPSELRLPASACRLVAHNMAANLPHNPELTAGLRKLLEAKDCFVRTVLADKDKTDPLPSINPDYQETVNTG